MDDAFSNEFPELKELPDLDDNSSSLAEAQIIINDTTNLDKIYEYLNEDMEEQDILLHRLEEFEHKIDEFLHNINKQMQCDN